MTDGRVYTIEDEIDVLHEDLGRARRRYDDMLRARVEQRIQESDYEQALDRQRGRVRELERALAEALEAQRQADDAELGA